MDGLDRKVEAVYAPGTPFQDAAHPPRRTTVSRRARILLVAATAAVTIGVHVFKRCLYYPEVLEHPAPMSLVAKLAKEFDWESVSRPSISHTAAPHPSPSTHPSSSSPRRRSTGHPATTASNALAFSYPSTTSPPTQPGRRPRSRCA